MGLVAVFAIATVKWRMFPLAGRSLRIGI